MQDAHLPSLVRSKCVFAGRISRIAWQIEPIQCHHAYPTFQSVLALVSRCPMGHGSPIGIWPCLFRRPESHRKSSWHHFSCRERRHASTRRVGCLQMGGKLALSAREHLRQKVDRTAWFSRYGEWPRLFRRRQFSRPCEGKSPNRRATGYWPHRHNSGRALLRCRISSRQPRFTVPAYRLGWSESNHREGASDFLTWDTLGFSEWNRSAPHWRSPKDQNAFG